jgi:2-amino-4-hydroxy-6-hydroxymethyldihydropteridine diphosphokinase
VTRTGFLGLGSNVGDPAAELQRAVDALPGHGIRVLACSSPYATDPVGEVLDQPAFLNAAVRIATDLEPEAVLDAAKAIEAARGRVPAGRPGYLRHGPRAVDVDILLLGDGHRSAASPCPIPRSWSAASRSSRCSSWTSRGAPAGVRLADALAALRSTTGCGGRTAAAGPRA